MLTIIDNYFCFVKLYGLKQKTALSVCKKIENFCEEFGSPEIMLSDEGLEFKNKEMTNCATYGITPYNSKGNGYCCSNTLKSV